MSKRRITLSLDDDVVDALEALDGPSLSAVANAALRTALELEAHRAALGRWLDELDAEHGTATDVEITAISEFLDAIAEPDDAPPPVFHRAR